MNPQNSPISMAEQMFILFMHDIEPDLLPGNIEKLGTKYAKETAEERAERMERYEQAFQQVEAKFNEVNRTWGEQVQEFLRSVRKQAEIDSAAEDIAMQDNIISQIDHDAQ